MCSESVMTPSFWFSEGYGFEFSKGGVDVDSKFLGCGRTLMAWGAIQSNADAAMFPCQAVRT